GSPVAGRRGAVRGAGRDALRGAGPGAVRAGQRAVRCLGGTVLSPAEPTRPGATVRGGLFGCQGGGDGVILDDLIVPAVGPERRQDHTGRREGEEGEQDPAE